MRGGGVVARQRLFDYPDLQLSPLLGSPRAVRTYVPSSLDSPLPFADTVRDNSQMAEANRSTRIALVRVIGAKARTRSWEFRCLGPCRGSKGTKVLSWGLTEKILFRGREFAR